MDCVCTPRRAVTKRARVAVLYHAVMVRCVVTCLLCLFWSSWQPWPRSKARHERSEHRGMAHVICEGRGENLMVVMADGTELNRDSIRQHSFVTDQTVKPLRPMTRCKVGQIPSSPKSRSSNPICWRRLYTSSNTKVDSGPPCKV